MSKGFKVWLIKRKGADYWGNYFPSMEFELPNGDTVYAQKCFYRKKDAVAYMKAKGYPDFYEVVGKQ